ncbi:ankyrin repeat domain-containing protein [uncultured Shewanella sp.]|uniref:ankyrin repeat domain-containing protein n=1 Tax=uncultured Shewanella sp. TaxID=173975 RepID=UPI0026353E60|nr:ankyrin repeat domain-containing protein [uncultured Shewanella sp.]
MRYFFTSLIIINVILFGLGNIVQAKPVNIPVQNTAASNTNDADINQLINYFFAAARTGDNTVINRFLEAGFPINQVNNQSYTSLMVAAYNGQYKTTQLLLQHGANACIQDKRGNTAIMGALIKAEVSIARLLYAQKCDETLTNKSGLTVEEFAQYWGQSEALNVTQ